MNISVNPIKALQDNYIWSIENNATRTAIIIDPGEAAPVLTYLQQHKLQLVAILITHHHWDHTNGISEIIEMMNVPVYGPAIEAISTLTHSVKQDSIISFAELPTPIKVLHIPGHTLGHLAYYVDGKLFCGDTLFSAGCGRVFEGTFTQMYQSLMKLRALPDATLVYCAHEYTLANLRFAKTVEPHNSAIQERIEIITRLIDQGQPSLPSTISAEKKVNPFLRCDVSEVMQSASAHAQRELSNPIEVFTVLREWKNNFK